MAIHSGIGLGLVLAVLTLSSNTRAEETQAPKEQKQKETQVAQLVKTLTGTQKVCSAVHSPNWRDTIVVPDTWTRDTCYYWAMSINAREWQLGCFFFNWYSWGAPGGYEPSPNCGW